MGAAWNLNGCMMESHRVQNGVSMVYSKFMMWNPTKTGKKVAGHSQSYDPVYVSVHVLFVQAQMFQVCTSMSSSWSWMHFRQVEFLPTCLGTPAGLSHNNSNQKQARKPAMFTPQSMEWWRQASFRSSSQTASRMQPRYKLRT